MPRLLVWLAMLLPAAALLLLIAQWCAPVPSFEERLLPTLEPAMLDSAQAFAEIEQLQAHRGSVLAGSALANVQAGKEFDTALASYVGYSPPPAEPASQQELTVQLRKTARLLEAQANSLEDSEQFEQERELRNLAAQLRTTAQELGLK